jgi:CHAT domain-containing protein
MRIESTTLALLILVGFVGCAHQEMGMPITTPEHIELEKPPNSATPAQQPVPLSPSNLKKWEDAWQQIQLAPTSGSWIDHYWICTIQYRFRKYDDLFRCLDLFERRILHLSAAEKDVEWIRRFSPVWTGWLRAGAYAELGSPDIALKWAQSAWDALPEYLRSPPRSVGVVQGRPRDRDTRAFASLCDRIAGNADNFSYSVGELQGRDNPAALDLAPVTIAMTLAAQRATALATLGHPDQAHAALDELRAWQAVRVFSPKMVLGIPYGLHAAPYTISAELLSTGPLFALHDYSGVVAAYHNAETAAKDRQRDERLQNLSSWLAYLSPVEWLGRYQDKMSDQRVFATALEDVSYALIYAESLARVSETDQARLMFDTILKIPEIQDMGSVYWAALYERGVIALHDGQQEQAIALLRRSVDAIERTRGTISYEAAKIGFAGDKQGVYATLVGAYAQQGDWSDAFLMAERAKARALVDLLAQQRSLAPPAGADDKVRTLLASATTTDGTLGLRVDSEVERNLSFAVDSRAALATAAPEAASLVSVQSVSLERIAGRLGADDTLIDYYRVGDTLYAILLSGRAVTGFKLSAIGMEEEVRAFRTAIEHGDADVAVRGRALYDRLIHPLEAGLKTGGLTISPHGILHYLPFAALSDGNGYLIDRFSIRLIPSAAVLVYLRTDVPAKMGKVLALGNPDLGDPKFDLPNAELEAKHVAALFPASKALVRVQASKTAIKTLGSGFSVLHFATHGMFDDTAPLASGLYLAKGDEPNGLLTVSDLYQLRFDSNLVTLSACQTALGKVANGDDVIGLTRGFLYAGARTIVASLWKVNDAATEQLMIAFYTHLRDHSSRDALRLAQIDTRSNYPSPALWAAFQIMGSAD